jgi:hypothetical protein
MQRKKNPTLSYNEPDYSKNKKGAVDLYSVETFDPLTHGGLQD